MPRTVAPSRTHLISEAAIRTAIFPIVRGLWRTRLTEGMEHLVREPCFLYGNHSNNLDPFLVNWELPLGQCSSGVLTAEYMQAGLVSAAFRGIGLLSTRKRVPEPHLVSRIVRLLRAGRNVLIYPEGGRRWDGRPGRWIESTAKLFSRVGVPVHPVVTHGSYVAWPRWADWPRPARIRVSVLPAVNFEGATDTEEKLRRLAAPIDIDENEPPEDTRPLWAFRPADGIQRLLYRDPRTGVNNALYSEDGAAIRSRTGDLEWSMFPDSRILDHRTGDILLTADLYRSIRAMPLQPDANGCLVRNRVEWLDGPDLAGLEPRGTCAIELHRDHVRISTPHHAETLDLDHITHEGVERNRKLQLTFRGRIVEFDFNGKGSALQWEDTIHRLRKEAA